MLPLPSLAPPQDPCSWRDLGGQRVRPGISTGSWGSKWAGETWPHSLLILCPPNGSLSSPFGCGILSLPSASPQGYQSFPTSTSPPLHSLHAPHPTQSLGVPPIPLSMVPHRCLVGDIVMRRCEFCVLLVGHLDFAPPPCILEELPPNSGFRFLDSQGKHESMLNDHGYSRGTHLFLVVRLDSSFCYGSS